MIRKGAVGSYSEYIVAHTDLKRNKIFILLRWGVQEYFSEFCKFRDVAWDTSVSPVVVRIK